MLNMATAADLKSVNAAPLTRDGTPSTLNVGDYSYVANVSVRYVWRWQLMGSTWARLAIRDFAKQRLALVAAGKTPTSQLDRDILELASQLYKKLPVTNAATPDWPVITATAVKTGLDHRVAQTVR